MPGIIDQRLHLLKSIYLRAALFNSDARAYFYATLREYLRSHFSLLEVFNHFQEHSNTPAIREIARISKRAIRDNRPFASGYYRTGLFTEQESNLLILGERHDCMDTVTNLLLEQDSRGGVTLQILSGSIQWIFMSIVISAMSVYTLPYLKNYTSGFTLFFDYVNFIKIWWPQLSALGASVLLLYYWCSYRLTGRLRAILLACGCFRLRAMLTELHFMKISGALIATRLPPDEFLSLMETTFATHRQFRQGLHKSRSRLKEASLLQVLRYVLSPYAYSHVLSFSPNQSPEEIARGFEMAGRMLNLRLLSAIRMYRALYTILFLTVSIVITIPFALVSMGMGIET